MFSGDKYITKGIESTIPKELQIFMWDKVCSLNMNSNFIVDYLQVFKLKSINENTVEIIHSQEYEEYKMRYLLNVKCDLNTKIYLINSYDENNNEYSTMLLANEY